MLTRRVLIASSLALAAAPAFAAAPFRNRVADIEGHLGGRIGATWLGPGGGTWSGYRQEERFLMCSTFKTFLVAATLQKARSNAFNLADAVVFTEADLVAYSPVLQARLVDGEGAASREELCEAAINASDNTAANLLLRDLGGPEALTRFMRRLGDGVTRMDRAEWALNYRDSASDLHDTSTPLAFVRSLRKVLFGGGVAPEDGRRLANLMRNCRNMPNRIRAGVPKDWDVGVKPGTNDAEAGAFNDVGFFKRAGGRMQMLVVFIEAPNAGAEACEAAIASIARLVAARS
jgi:beta-lactamase class A